MLHAQTGAAILIPNVTQLEYASLRVDDTGTISTAQLNLLTNVALTVDGSVPNFGRVTNIDDCDIFAFNGLVTVSAIDHGHLHELAAAYCGGTLQRNRLRSYAWRIRQQVASLSLAAGLK